MRIALYHNTPSGGAKRAIFEWTRRLVARHSVDVYTLSSADHTYCDIRPLVQTHRSIDFIPQKLYGSPFGRMNQLQRWRDLGRLEHIGRQIASKIDRGRYDIVFAHPCLYTFIPTFLEFVQTPTVYYLHEPLGQTMVRPISRPYWKDDHVRVQADRFDPLIKLYHRRLAAIQRRGIERTQRLLANSTFTQEQMHLTYGVATPVCHYGVDSDQFYPLPDNQKEDFVLSVGELSPRKGFDFLVQSLAHIAQPQRPRLKLACNVVQEPERRYIEDLAKQNQVALEIQSGLNVEQLRRAYNRARLCVYTPVLEPFGLVALEAMSCGTPVVGVREGGVQESVVHEQTGLLVARDPSQFGAAVQQLLSDPTRLAEYGRNARQHIVRNWSWENSVSAVADHLHAFAAVSSVAI